MCFVQIKVRILKELMQSKEEPIGVSVELLEMEKDEINVNMI